MLAQIERFVNWVRRRNPQARTWRDYTYDLKIFRAVVGNRPLRDLTFQDIDYFVQAQVGRGLKPTTINRRLAAITSLYTFLAVEDETLTCPVLPRRHFLREPQSLPRPVKQADLQNFFQAIDHTRDRAMFLLMLRCGLRIAEVAGMLLEDLFLEEDRPRLVVRGKYAKERAVYLSFQAETALRAWLAERPAVTSDYVFLSYLGDGLSTTAIHKRLMRYRRLAGVSLTAHQLRHSFANDLIEADMPVTNIQKLLGHRWLESTQTYVQANDKQVQADFFAACERLQEWA